MTVNMLQMNRDKTELVVQVQVITYLRPLRPISVCDQLISKSSVARNIGVLYDTFISIEHHVSHIQYCFLAVKSKDVIMLHSRLVRIIHCLSGR